MIIYLKHYLSKPYLTFKHAVSSSKRFISCPLGHVDQEVVGLDGGLPVSQFTASIIPPPQKAQCLHKAAVCGDRHAELLIDWPQGLEEAGLPLQRHASA